MDRKTVGCCVISLLILAACGGGNRIVVGSKNFTEQVILGEIVAQHLERRLGERAERRLNLGGTLLAHQALLSGQIDVYPEYSGTALTAILNRDAAADAGAVYQIVGTAYRKLGLEWLAPLGFNNSFAMVIPGELSRRQNLSTLSEAARWQHAWRLGVGYEFEGRPDGLPALLRTYKLQVSGPPRSMDLGLLYQALERGQVDMIAANSTDGLLSKMDTAVLTDDRGAFPPYEAGLVVRSETLARVPKVREVLAELSGKISTGVMQRLNYRVDVDHEAVGAVAADFLREAGL
ncbi:MAG: hypothetical protein KJZ78_11970 [Bryobacteraceae bacterium]|nr:hypothetical protein [Bryobacteraceae bacterium]